MIYLIAFLLLICAMFLGAIAYFMYLEYKRNKSETFRMVKK